MSAIASTATLSDEALMHRVQHADDQKAFACLYDRHASKAFRIARSICTSPARAEEAVQEGFLSIWRGRARYDSTKGGFGAWSMTIVRCAALDAVRFDLAGSRPRLTQEQPQAVDARATSPEDQSIARHDVDALRGALAELPEAQAEVITLAFFGELSHSEIAHQLDLPPGTVKGRMRLGLEKLRTSVERDT